MKIVSHMIRVLGLEQFVSCVVDIDQKVLFTCIRWSVAYSNQEAQLFINRLERSLKI